MENNANQPVYPDPMRGAEPSFINQNPHSYPSGLTKREYFAGLAMQSYIYNVRRSEHEPDEKLQNRIAILSVQMTDALLKALEQDQPQKAS